MALFTPASGPSATIKPANRGGVFSYLQQQTAAQRPGGTLDQIGSAPPPADPTPPPSDSGGGPPAPNPTGLTFSDPATVDWEKMLRNATTQLSAPRQNPDFQPMVDYLHTYLGQLQGPAYTPAQSEVMQTQALDPLEHQRAIAKQQVIERFAKQGVTPTSGIVNSALEHLDQQFNQLRTGTQSAFASKAIDQTQKNAATAAQVSQTLAGLQDTKAGTDEQRMLNAVNMMFQIPSLADSRLASANQTLSGGANLQSILGPLLTANQNQTGQDATFWTQFFQSILPLLGH